MLRAVFDVMLRARSHRRVCRAAQLSLVLALLAAGGELWHPDAAVRAADVTISGTTRAGPVSGSGGTFTVTTTGTITSTGAGIVATSTTGITTLTVNGVVGPVSTHAIQNNAGSSITSINISGTATGGSSGQGLLNSGTVGSLTTNRPWPKWFSWSLTG